MADDSEDWREVPQLRSLRRLVSALTIVLIFGMITVAATLIWRISSEDGGAPAIDADQVTLPAGEVITAVGATEDALTFVTKDAEGVERMRVFDPATGGEIGVLGVERR